jgi:hypothetical protein
MISVVVIQRAMGYAPGSSGSDALILAMFVVIVICLAFIAYYRLRP